MTGTLVTLEGIDGSGKSSVIRRLEDELEDVFTTSEPQEDQWLGRVLRESLSRDDMNDMALFFMFLAEHAQHVENFIDPALEDKDLVISDRYIDSRYAYQSYSIDDHVDEPTLSWIRNVQRAGWSTLPDLTIILDISVDTALERLEGHEKEVFENREQLEAARETYLSLGRMDAYTIIDAEQPLENVTTECITAIENELVGA